MLNILQYIEQAPTTKNYLPPMSVVLGLRHIFLRYLPQALKAVEKMGTFSKLQFSYESWCHMHTSDPRVFLILHYIFSGSCAKCQKDPFYFKWCFIAPQQGFSLLGMGRHKPEMSAELFKTSFFHQFGCISQFSGGRGCMVTNRHS